jgi:hypothetical protein
LDRIATSKGDFPLPFSARAAVVGVFDDLRCDLHRQDGRVPLALDEELPSPLGEERVAICFTLILPSNINVSQHYYFNKY